MTTPHRIYDADQMTKIATLFQRVTDAIDEFEGDTGGAPTLEHPLYVYGMEMVIHHRDGYTIGRIGMDDFPYFELTDENYVSAAEQAIEAAVATHMRQEDTASGQRR